MHKIYRNGSAAENFAARKSVLLSLPRPDFGVCRKCFSKIFFLKRFSPSVSNKRANLSRAEPGRLEPFARDEHSEKKKLDEKYAGFQNKFKKKTHTHTSSTTVATFVVAAMVPEPPQHGVC